MTITINGTAGIDFNVTESDTALTTGSLVQAHVVESDISDIVLANTDLVASLSGFMGTNNLTFDFTNLVSMSGGDFDISVVRNHNVPFGKIKSLVIHNKTAATNILTIEGVVNSFIKFGNNNDNVEIQPNSAVSFVFPNALDCTVDKFLELDSTALNTLLEIYILGTP